MRSRMGTKDVRAMWGPFLDGNSCIVEGSLSAATLSEALPGWVPTGLKQPATDLLPHIESYLRDQEPAGLMGRGDHEAIVRVQAGLARAGLPHTLPVRADYDLGERKKDNLIVVGGPDVNSVTKELLKLLDCAVTIAMDDSDRNGVEDLIHGQRYVTRAVEAETRDYGILIKAPSPYQEGKHVLILAGAHGFGCMAAGYLAVNDIANMANLSRRFPHGFECIVSYRRSGETLTEKNLVVLARPLRDTA
ncbi:hypothetical protein ACFTSF_03690 [Kribbella sp. NPDC056951]|uniref:hypothetical protein n=1 Tax=Kribbella sp. NPDC056951 TaxID=3345978 RepID=UPI00363558A1